MKSYTVKSKYIGRECTIEMIDEELIKSHFPSVDCIENIVKTSRIGYRQLNYGRSIDIFAYGRWVNIKGAGTDGHYRYSLRSNKIKYIQANHKAKTHFNGLLTLEEAKQDLKMSNMVKNIGIPIIRTYAILKIDDIHCIQVREYHTRESIKYGLMNTLSAISIQQQLKQYNIYAFQSGIYIPQHHNIQATKIDISDDFKLVDFTHYRYIESPYIDGIMQSIAKSYFRLKFHSYTHPEIETYIKKGEDLFEVSTEVEIWKKYYNEPIGRFDLLIDELNKIGFPEIYSNELNILSIYKEQEHILNTLIELRDKSVNKNFKLKLLRHK